MSDSIDQLIQQLQANDAQAIEFVFQRYSGQMVRLAQRKLGMRLRRKIDPEDIAQSALASFFRLQPEELSFENWDALWGLLSLITVRKCFRQIEYFQAERRDVGQERSAVLNPIDAEASRNDWVALAQDPSPSQAAILAETVEELLRPLDERDRRIVTLTLEGATVEEISAEIGRSERTVQRVLERLKLEILRRCERPS